MFNTSLNRLIGIKYPIIQGALGSSSRPVSDATLVSSVSDAGGLGVLSTWNQSDSRILKEIDRVRDLTDKPFGVNVAATHSSYDFSKKARLLADAVVASGCEGGGQVVDAVKIPVIAAGGIGDARGFVAAMALGACGVQMGTRFMVTLESILPSLLKEKILRALTEDAVVTTMKTGWPTRVLKSRFTEEWEKLNRSGASSEDLRTFRRMVFKRGRDNMEEDSIGAGQVCGMLNELKSVKEVIHEIIENGSRIIAGLEKDRREKQGEERSGDNDRKEKEE